MERSVDFAKTAVDYRNYRHGFPAVLFDRLASLGVLRQNLTALDLGTGTGAVARALAGRGCAVIGLDPAAAMLVHARDLDKKAGVSAEYRVGTAEETGFPDDHFDLVTAGQCWHWFDRDRAAAEARRVLKPGGTLVIAHFDWLAVEGSVVAATEALILAHNPGWTMAGGTGIYPDWLADAVHAGFGALETFSADLDVAFSHEAWRGRIRASAGVGASLPAEAIAAFDRDHAALLARDFPEDPLAVPHRLWALLARAPG